MSWHYSSSAGLRMFEECYILHLAQTDIASAEFLEALKSNEFHGRYEHASTLMAAQNRITAGERPNIIVAEGAATERLGDEMLKWLGANHAGNRVPVMVYSPVIDEKEFEGALRAGAVAYLIKNTDLGESVRRVRRILEFCEGR